MKSVCALLLLLGCATPVLAEWRIASATSDFSPDQAVEHRHVVMSDGAGAEATLELAVFSAKSASFHVYEQTPGALQDLAEVMQREHCTAGANGGYFDQNFAPMGLLIANGKVLSPLRKARLFSGIAASINGRVQLLRVAEYSPRRSPTAAIQGGPFLVDRGQAVAGLNDTRGARRTFMATGAERAAIGFCSGATLAELAHLLLPAGVIGEGKIDRALNLDGGSSSAFWFGGGARAISIGEQKSVRDFIGVVRK